MTPSSCLTRRAIILAGCAVPLTGCAGQDGLDADTIKTVLGNSLGLNNPPSISFEQAAAVPFSSIGYRLGNSPELMLVLSTNNGEDLLWTSALRCALVTRGGRVSKSAGFAWNLTDSIFPSGDPVAKGLLDSLSSETTTSFADFSDIGRFNVPFFGRIKRVGQEAIEILGESLSTNAFVETRRCDLLNWEFQNRYWADPHTGFVWKSQQYIHPNLEPLSIEVLRPPT